MTSSVKYEMKTSPQKLYREAELLKGSLGDSPLNKESVSRRQELCRLLELLLLNDLDYALDKKVEQDLWNLVFRNPITALQVKAAEKKNASQSHQSQLSFNLDSASGFYLQLLQKIACANEVDRLCHIPGSSLGVFSAWKTKSKANRSSVLYICQHCMVHLGDIARYRGQSLQAETFYRNAVELIPSNGHAYNQLAILEASSGEKLSTVFFYVRSLAVQHPFPAAATNLQKLFTKMIADGLGPAENNKTNSEVKSRMSSYEYISAFLQFQALVHVGTDFQKAEQVLCQLTTSLPALIIAEKLETWQLLQMAAICMFAVDHAMGLYEGQTCSSNNRQKDTLLSQDERSALSLILDLIAAMLNALILPLHAVLDSQETGDYYTIPVVKVLLDWLLQHHHSLPGDAFRKRPQIWHGLCKLLNDLKPSEQEDPKFEGVPLHEDWDLQCFLPLQKSHLSLKFNNEPTDMFQDSELNRSRVVRLLQLALKFVHQEMGGTKVISVVGGDDGSQVFTAVQSAILTEQVLQQIQELSVTGNPPISLVEDSPGATPPRSKGLSTASQSLEVRFKLDEEPSPQTKPIEHTKVQPREKRAARQNVAMQAILQQRASQQNYTNSNQPKDVHPLVNSNGSQRIPDSYQAVQSMNPVKLDEKRTWMSPYNLMQAAPTVNQLQMRQSYGLAQPSSNLPPQAMTSQNLPPQSLHFQNGPSPAGLDYGYNQYALQQEQQIQQQQQNQQNQQSIQRPITCMPTQQNTPNPAAPQQFISPPAGMVWNYVSYLPANPQQLSAPGLRTTQGQSVAPQGQQGTNQVMPAPSHPLLITPPTTGAPHRMIHPSFLIRPDAADVHQGMMGEAFGGNGNGQAAREAALAFHYGNNMRMQNGEGQGMMSTGNMAMPQGNITNQTTATEVGTNTYSLFSSPWCSALAAPRTVKECSTGNERDQGVMQPRIQSLWSGPGPSPLERLLEQQKQRREAANQ